MSNYDFDAIVIGSGMGGMAGSEVPDPGARPHTPLRVADVAAAPDVGLVQDRLRPAVILEILRPARRVTLPLPADRRQDAAEHADRRRRRQPARG